MTESKKETGFLKRTAQNIPGSCEVTGGSVSRNNLNFPVDTSDSRGIGWTGAADFPSDKTGLAKKE